MKPRSLFIAMTGILIVIPLTTLLWQQHRLAQSREELLRLRAESEQLPALRQKVARLESLEVDRAQLEHLRQAQDKATRELAKLRGQAAHTRRVEAENAQLQAQSTSATNGIAGPMGEMMQSGIERMSLRRVNRMQERLNLSPAQAQGIQEILLRRSQGIAEATKGVIAGKIDQQKLAALRQGQGDPESQIRALLSPEQQTAYAAFQEEEKVNAAQLAAHGELLQMQHILALTEDQQDKVLAVLYAQALERDKIETAEPRPSNPAEAMQKVAALKLQAMEGILTPTQLANYRQDQELQLKFLKGLLTQTEPLLKQP